VSAETKPFEIVLAEDNPADAELVRMALKEHHVHCTLRVLRDGAKAVELLESLDTDPKSPPLDLLLLDMHLPKLDGAEILHRLRSTERHGQMPVIVLSGLNSPMIEETATRHAALFYFRKPSSFEEHMQLGGIVRGVLQNTTRGAA